MGLEIPDWVRTVFLISTGEYWPAADETRLRQLAQTWTDLTTEITTITSDITATTATLTTNWHSQAATGATTTLTDLTNPTGALTQLTTGATTLATYTRTAALNVEYTKYMIIGQLAILSTNIAILIPWLLFPATTAAAAAEIAAIQILGRYITNQLIRRLAISLLYNLTTQVGLDAAIQTAQTIQGNRTTWDTQKTANAAITSLIGVGVGEALHHLTKLLPTRLTNTLLAHMATGATHEYTTEAIADALPLFNGTKQAPSEWSLAAGATESLIENLSHRARTHLANRTNTGLPDTTTIGPITTPTLTDTDTTITFVDPPTDDSEPLKQDIISPTGQNRVTVGMATIHTNHPDPLSLPLTTTTPATNPTTTTTTATPPTTGTNRTTASAHTPTTTPPTTATTAPTATATTTVTSTPPTTTAPRTHTPTTSDTNTSPTITGTGTGTPGATVTASGPATQPPGPAAAVNPDVVARETPATIGSILAGFPTAGHVEVPLDAGPPDRPVDATAPTAADTATPDPAVPPRATPSTNQHAAPPTDAFVTTPADPTPTASVVDGSTPPPWSSSTVDDHGVTPSSGDGDGTGTGQSAGTTGWSGHDDPRVPVPHLSSEPSGGPETRLDRPVTPTVATTPDTGTPSPTPTGTDRPPTGLPTHTAPAPISPVSGPTPTLYTGGPAPTPPVSTGPAPTPPSVPSPVLPSASSPDTPSRPSPSPSAVGGSPVPAIPSANGRPYPGRRPNSAPGADKRPAAEQQDTPTSRTAPGKIGTSPQGGSPSGSTRGVAGVVISAPATVTHQQDTQDPPVGATANAGGRLRPGTGSPTPPPAVDSTAGLPPQVPDPGVSRPSPQAPPPPPPSPDSHPTHVDPLLRQSADRQGQAAYDEVLRRRRDERAEAAYQLALLTGITDGQPGLTGWSALEAEEYRAQHHRLRTLDGTDPDGLAEVAYWLRVGDALDGLAPPAAPHWPGRATEHDRIERWHRRLGLVPDQSLVDRALAVAYADRVGAVFADAQEPAAAAFGETRTADRPAAVVWATWGSPERSASGALPPALLDRVAVTRARVAVSQRVLTGTAARRTTALARATGARHQHLAAALLTDPPEADREAAERARATARREFLEHPPRPLPPSGDTGGAREVLQVFPRDADGSPVDGYEVDPTGRIRLRTGVVIDRWHRLDDGYLVHPGTGHRLSLASGRIGRATVEQLDAAGEGPGPVTVRADLLGLSVVTRTRPDQVEPDRVEFVPMDVRPRFPSPVTAVEAAWTAPLTAAQRQLVDEAGDNAVGHDQATAVLDRAATAAYARILVDALPPADELLTRRLAEETAVRALIDRYRADPTGDGAAALVDLLTAERVASLLERHREELQRAGEAVAAELLDDPTPSALGSDDGWRITRSYAATRLAELLAESPAGPATGTALPGLLLVLEPTTEHLSRLAEARAELYLARRMGSVTRTAAEAARLARERVRRELRDEATAAAEWRIRHLTALAAAAEQPRRLPYGFGEPDPVTGEPRYALGHHGRMLLPGGPTADGPELLARAVVEALPTGTDEPLRVAVLRAMLDLLDRYDARLVTQLMLEEGLTLEVSTGSDSHRVRARLDLGDLRRAASAPRAWAEPRRPGESWVALFNADHLQTAAYGSAVTNRRALRVTAGPPPFGAIGPVIGTLQATSTTRHGWDGGVLSGAKRFPVVTGTSVHIDFPGAAFLTTVEAPDGTGPDRTGRLDRVVRGEFPVESTPVAPAETADARPPRSVPLPGSRRYGLDSGQLQRARDSASLGARTGAPVTDEEEAVLDRAEALRGALSQVPAVPESVSGLRGVRSDILAFLDGGRRRLTEDARREVRWWVSEPTVLRMWGLFRGSGAVSPLLTSGRDSVRITLRGSLVNATPVGVGPVGVVEEVQFYRRLAGDVSDSGEVGVASRGLWLGGTGGVLGAGFSATRSTATEVLAGDIRSTSTQGESVRYAVTMAVDATVATNLPGVPPEGTVTGFVTVDLWVPADQRHRFEALLALAERRPELTRGQVLAELPTDGTDNNGSTMDLEGSVVRYPPAALAKGLTTGGATEILAGAEDVLPTVLDLLGPWLTGMHPLDRAERQGRLSPLLASQGLIGASEQLFRPGGITVEETFPRDGWTEVIRIRVEALRARHPTGTGRKARAGIESMPLAVVTHSGTDGLTAAYSASLTGEVKVRDPWSGIGLTLGGRLGGGRSYTDSTSVGATAVVLNGTIYAGPVRYFDYPVTYRVSLEPVRADLARLSPAALRRLLRRPERRTLARAELPNGFVRFVVAEPLAPTTPPDRAEIEATGTARPLPAGESDRLGVGVPLEPDEVRPVLTGTDGVRQQIIALLAELGLDPRAVTSLADRAADVTELHALLLQGAAGPTPTLVRSGVFADTGVRVRVEIVPLARRPVGDPVTLHTLHLLENGPAVSSTRSVTTTRTAGWNVAFGRTAPGTSGVAAASRDHAGTRTVTRGAGLGPNAGTLMLLLRPHREHVGDVLYRVTVSLVRSNLIGRLHRRVRAAAVLVRDGLRVTRPVDPTRPVDDDPAADTGPSAMAYPSTLPVVPATAVTRALVPAHGPDGDPLLTVVTDLLTRHAPELLTDHWSVDGTPNVPPAPLAALVNTRAAVALADLLLGTGLVLHTTRSHPGGHERFTVVLRAERDPTGQGYRRVAVLDESVVSAYTYRFNTVLTANATGTSVETGLGGQPNQDLPAGPLSGIGGAAGVRRNRGTGQQHSLTRANAERNMPMLPGTAAEYEGPLELTATLVRVRVASPLVTLLTGDLARRLASPRGRGGTVSTYLVERVLVQQAMLPAPGEPAVDATVLAELPPGTPVDRLGRRLAVTPDDVLARRVVSHQVDPAAVRVLLDAVLRRLSGERTGPGGAPGPILTRLFAPGSRARDALHQLLSTAGLLSQLDLLLTPGGLVSPQLTVAGGPLTDRTGTVTLRVELANPRVLGLVTGSNEWASYGYTQHTAQGSRRTGDGFDLNLTPGVDSVSGLGVAASLDRSTQHSGGDRLRSLDHTLGYRYEAPMALVNTDLIVSVVAEATNRRGPLSHGQDRLAMSFRLPGAQWLLVPPDGMLRHDLLPATGIRTASGRYLPSDVDTGVDTGTGTGGLTPRQLDRWRAAAAFPAVTDAVVVHVTTLVDAAGAVLFQVGTERLTPEEFHERVLSHLDLGEGTLVLVGSHLAGAAPHGGTSAAVRLARLTGRTVVAAPGEAHTTPDGHVLSATPGTNRSGQALLVRRDTWYAVSPDGARTPGTTDLLSTLGGLGHRAVAPDRPALLPRQPVEWGAPATAAVATPPDATPIAAILEPGPRPGPAVDGVDRAAHLQRTLRLSDDEVTRLVARLGVPDSADGRITAIETAALHHLLASAGEYHSLRDLHRLLVLAHELTPDAPRPLTGAALLPLVREVVDPDADAVTPERLAPLATALRRVPAPATVASLTELFRTDATRLRTGADSSPARAREVARLTRAVAAAPDGGFTFTAVDLRGLVTLRRRLIDDPRSRGFDDLASAYRPLAERVLGESTGDPVELASLADLVRRVREQRRWPTFGEVEVSVADLRQAALARDWPDRAGPTDGPAAVDLGGQHARYAPRLPGLHAVERVSGVAGLTSWLNAVVPGRGGRWTAGQLEELLRAGFSEATDGGLRLVSPDGYVVDLFAEIAEAPARLATEGPRRVVERRIYHNEQELTRSGSAWWSTVADGGASLDTPRQAPIGATTSASLGGGPWRGETRHRTVATSRLMYQRSEESAELLRVPVRWRARVTRLGTGQSRAYRHGDGRPGHVLLAVPGHLTRRPDPAGHTELGGNHELPLWTVPHSVELTHGAARLRDALREQLGPQRYARWAAQLDTFLRGPNLAAVLADAHRDGADLDWTKVPALELRDGDDFLRLDLRATAVSTTRIGTDTTKAPFELISRGVLGTGTRTERRRLTRRVLRGEVRAFGSVGFRFAGTTGRGVTRNRLVSHAPAYSLRIHDRTRVLLLHSRVVARVRWGPDGPGAPVPTRPVDLYSQVRLRVRDLERTPADTSTHPAPEPVWWTPSVGAGLGPATVESIDDVAGLYDAVVRVLVERGLLPTEASGPDQSPWRHLQHLLAAGGDLSAPVADRAGPGTRVVGEVDPGRDAARYDNWRTVVAHLVERSLVRQAPDLVGDEPGQPGTVVTLVNPDPLGPPVAVGLSLRLDGTARYERTEEVSPMVELKSLEASAVRSTRGAADDTAVSVGGSFLGNGAQAGPVDTSGWSRAHGTTHSTNTKLVAQLLDSGPGATGRRGWASRFALPATFAWALIEGDTVRWQGRVATTVRAWQSTALTGVATVTTPPTATVPPPEPGAAAPAPEPEPASPLVGTAVPVVLAADGLGGLRTAVRQVTGEPEPTVWSTVTMSGYLGGMPRALTTGQPFLVGQREVVVRTTPVGTPRVLGRVRAYTQVGDESQTGFERESEMTRGRGGRGAASGAAGVTRVEVQLERTAGTGSGSRLLRSRGTYLTVVSTAAHYLVATRVSTEVLTDDGRRAVTEGLLHVLVPASTVDREPARFDDPHAVLPQPSPTRPAGYDVPPDLVQGAWWNGYFQQAVGVRTLTDAVHRAAYRLGGARLAAQVAALRIGAHLARVADTGLERDFRVGHRRYRLGLHAEFDRSRIHYRDHHEDGGMELYRRGVDETTVRHRRTDRSAHRIGLGVAVDAGPVAVSGTGRVAAAQTTEQVRSTGTNQLVATGATIRGGVVEFGADLRFRWTLKRFDGRARLRELVLRRPRGSSGTVDQPYLLHLSLDQVRPAAGPPAGAPVALWGELPATARVDGVNLGALDGAFRHLGAVRDRSSRAPDPTTLTRELLTSVEGFNDLLRADGRRFTGILTDRGHRRLPGGVTVSARWVAVLRVNPTTDVGVEEYHQSTGTAGTLDSRTDQHGGQVVLTGSGHVAPGFGLGGRLTVGAERATSTGYGGSVDLQQRTRHKSVRRPFQVTVRVAYTLTTHTARTEVVDVLQLSVDRADAQRLGIPPEILDGDRRERTDTGP
jgi:hypothetical protein